MEKKTKEALETLHQEKNGAPFACPVIRIDRIGIQT
jgi:hypothetical protein